MICPACGAWNRDEAAFCKACGADVSKAPRTAAQATPPVVPRPSPPRPWWHPVGVLVLVAGGMILIDVAGNGRVTWSFVATLGAAFIVGGILLLQHVAAADPRDRRPFVVGAALLASAVVLLPVAVALQSTATFTQTITVPDNASVTSAVVSVSDETGHLTVLFAADPGFLVQAKVTHIGGLFSSHYPGDTTSSNSTSGPTLTFDLAARAVSGFFFLGGHDVTVVVNSRLVTSLALSSTTGTISVDVPSGVAIGPGGISASVTTGDVRVDLTNASFASGGFGTAGVKAVSTTGSVTIDLDQEQVFAAEVPIQGVSTTGSVTFAFDAVPGIAASVSSILPTGSVDYDPAKYSGPSATQLYAPSQAAYGTATMRFDVTLQTTTGGIRLG